MFYYLRVNYNNSKLSEIYEETLKATQSYGNNWKWERRNIKLNFRFTSNLYNFFMFY